MSKVPDQIEALQATNVCCYDYSEIDYQKIDFGDELRIEIGPGYPVFDFESGKSYFVALQLPERRDVYMLEVRTFLHSDPMYKGYFFEPMLVPLDEEFRPLNDSIGLELHFKQPFFGGERWVGSVPIEPGVRHVAIYTDSSRAGSLRSRGSRATFGSVPGGGVVYAGEDGGGTVERGVDGRLRIKLIP